MDRELIEKYKSEILKMYKASKREIPVMAQPIQADGTGNLLAVVTTVDRLYPVNNAKVTIFTGSLQNMDIIDTDFTDDSGKSKVFTLPTPQKQLSLESDNTIQPYSLYNMMVSAEGYLDNIHLNIPVFSGVTSVQGSNLMLKETAGANMQSNVYDESQKYNL